MFGGQDAAQVDGQAGRADAAGGAGDGDHRAAAGPCRRRAAVPLPGDALQRGRQVFGLERLREKLLGPGAHRPQNQIAVGRGAGDQDRALGGRLGQRGDQLQRLVRIAVERDEADVGIRLADDVGEELVARALGLEPDGVQAQAASTSARRAMASFGSTTAIRRTLPMNCERSVSVGASVRRLRDDRRARQSRQTRVDLRPYSARVAYGATARRSRPGRSSRPVRPANRPRRSRLCGLFGLVALRTKTGWRGGLYGRGTVYSGMPCRPRRPALAQRRCERGSTRCGGSGSASGVAGGSGMESGSTIVRARRGPDSASGWAV